jgi:hypothetical protein
VYSAIDMSITNSADLNVISNFHSLYFSVGQVLMFGNSFEKKKMWKVSMRCEVKEFYGNFGI